MIYTFAPNPKRLATASMLCALAFSACGTSSGGQAGGADADAIEIADEFDYGSSAGGANDDSIVPQPAEPTDLVARADNINTATDFDDIEFGSTVEEFHATGERAAPVNVTVPGFQLIDWEHLVPPGFSSEEVLDRYQDRLAAAEPGSAELDALYAEMNAEYDAASVNTEFDEEKIQLAGFVAPLTYDGDAVTEFLLVPYFGACIHVPAPPVNQTIMVTLPEGDSLTLEESWGAVWVAGTIDVTSVNTDLATAGYAISDAQFGVYENQ